MSEIVMSGPTFVAWREQRSSEMQRKTAQREAGASELRWYDHAAVPGVLQAPGYIRAMIDIALGAVGDTDDWEAAVAERQARRESWLESTTTTTHFVVAEQALYSVLGGVNVMREQLQLLLRPLPGNATLGIIPRSAHFNPATTSFMLFDSSEAVIETITGSLRFDDAISISDYRAAFDSLSAQAVRGLEADALIRQALASHT